MKKTALSHVHKELGAKMVEFAGYQMPLEYEGVTKEHLTVRNEAGIFDVSHMGEFWLKGRYAIDLIQKISTNDVARLEVGQAQYSCMPNGKGGIVDDLIIYRYEEEKYMLVVNASNKQKDWEWIEKHNNLGVEMDDASDTISLIAIQGPKAQEILQTLTSVNLDNIGSFHFVTGAVAGKSDVIISATGYTGSGGFELYCYNNAAEQIWKSLIEEGWSKGLKPVGLAARDTLRLEMGYCLYGNDIDDSTSPLEAGLGWIVKFAEGKEFIDREFLQNQKLEGIRKKLIGIELIDKGIPRHGYDIVNALDEKIGYITSGTMSPVLKKGIGMAYLQIDYAKADQEVFVLVRNKKLKAKVVRFPFVK